MWDLDEFLKNLNKLNSFKNINFKDSSNRTLILSVISLDIIDESRLLYSEYSQTLSYSNFII